MDIDRPSRKSIEYQIKSEIIVYRPRNVCGAPISFQAEEFKQTFSPSLHQGLIFYWKTLKLSIAFYGDIETHKCIIAIFAK